MLIMWRTSTSKYLLLAALDGGRYVVGGGNVLRWRRVHLGAGPLPSLQMMRPEGAAMLSQAVLTAVAASCLSVVWNVSGGASLASVALKDSVNECGSLVSLALLWAICEQALQIAMTASLCVDDGDGDQRTLSLQAVIAPIGQVTNQTNEITALFLRHQDNNSPLQRDSTLLQWQEEYLLGHTRFQSVRGKLVEVGRPRKKKKKYQTLFDPKPLLLLFPLLSTNP